jgi:hypothetical protein
MAMTYSRRRYMSHRRAYFPRIWPLAVASLALSIVFATVFAPVPLWLGVPVGFLIGSGITQGRLIIWRRRHPVITPAQFLEDVRSAAPYN